MVSAPILFDKYVIPKGGSIPSYLNVRGAIAITQDKRHKGILHFIFYIIQKIHNYLFGRTDNVSLAHGMVIWGKDGNRPNNLLISHVHKFKKGIVTSSANYLDASNPDNFDVTHLVIWIPRDENLREILAKNAEQSAFNPKNPNNRIKEPAKFSVPDILRTIFTSQVHLRPPEDSMKRIALAVADLLLDRHLHNKRNCPRDLYCTPYTMILLQSSLLMEAMSDKDRNEIVEGGDRKMIASRICQRLKTYNSKDPISKIFWKNNLFCLNNRFCTSGYAASLLDSQSAPAINL